MTGATLEVEPHYPFYENVRPNVALTELTKAHAERLGMRLDEPEPASQRGAGGSTDFGNVSQVMPSFAMSFAISEEPVPGHSKLWAAAARSELGEQNALLCAKALSATACELLERPELVAAAKEEFEARGLAIASASD
jgi:metal-dependent amidase/aminoacylase/carboxypeptidase family protein